MAQYWYLVIRAIFLTDGKSCFFYVAAVEAAVEQEEPLLAENKQRFVLFPIVHKEVHTLLFFFSSCATWIDLAHVQET